MRAWFALTFFAVGFAACSAASAADGPSGYVSSYASAGVRAPQLLVYTDEPGTYRRAYWRAPWQHRHYFPFTGKKPKVGRYERLSAVQRPAKTFYREWSTLSLYPPGVADAPASADQPLLPPK